MEEVSSGLAQAIVKSILSLGELSACDFYFELIFSANIQPYALNNTVKKIINKINKFFPII